MEIPVNTHTKRTAANIPNNNNSIIRLREYYTADIFLFLSCFFFTLIYFDIKKQKLCTVLHSTIASVFLIFFQAVSFADAPDIFDVFIIL